jgi:hypothetical protein
MRIFLLAAILAAVITAFGATGASAARNPSGMGQPGVECGDPGATIEPHGFGTTGFANAETHYADTDGTHAVSQYDVACFQVTSNRHGG